MTTTASGADSRNERNLASADRAAAGSVDGAVGERVGFMAAARCDHSPSQLSTASGVNLNTAAI
jgi:hypothetical protein